MINFHQNVTLSNSFADGRSRVIGNRCKNLFNLQEVRLASSAQTCDLIGSPELFPLMWKSLRIQNKSERINRIDWFLFSCCDLFESQSLQKTFTPQSAGIVCCSLCKNLSGRYLMVWFAFLSAHERCGGALGVRNDYLNSIAFDNRNKRGKPSCLLIICSQLNLHASGEKLLAEVRCPYKLGTSLQQMHARRHQIILCLCFRIQDLRLGHTTLSTTRPISCYTTPQARKAFGWTMSFNRTSGNSINSVQNFLT